MIHIFDKLSGNHFFIDFQIDSIFRSGEYGGKKTQGAWRDLMQSLLFWLHDEGENCPE
jgi:hypothetical protein